MHKNGLTYQVIIEKISAGNSPDVVCACLSKSFKTSSEKFINLKNGKSIIISTGASYEKAKRYHLAIEQCGCIVAVKPWKGSKPAPTKMICPKCGFKQTNGEECIKCGIIFKKHLKRLETDENNAIKYDTTMRDIIKGYKNKLTNKHFYFAPDIPDVLLTNVLALYASSEIHLHADDIILLVDETLFAKDASDHTILTNRSMLSMSFKMYIEAEYIIMTDIQHLGLLTSILQLSFLNHSNSRILSTAGFNAGAVISMLRKLNKAALKAKSERIMLPLRHRIAINLKKQNTQTELSSKNIFGNNISNSSIKTDKTILLISCKVCQKEISKNAPTCPHCGEPYANNSKNLPDFPHSEIKYASFWKRCVAFILDLIIILISTSIMIAASGEQPDTALGIFMLIMWIYHAVLESLPAQGSLGKMIMRIKVTDVDGNRIGIGKAIAHGFARYFSNFFFGLGYFMVFFTQKKQCLHDMAAGCIVVDK